MPHALGRRCAAVDAWAHAHHLFLHSSVTAAPGMPSAEAGGSSVVLNCEPLNSIVLATWVHKTTHPRFMILLRSFFLPRARAAVHWSLAPARASAALWGPVDTGCPRYTRKESAARTMNRTRLIALGCDIAQCSTHDPRSRCHRMHDTVFGIEDVHDLNSAHM